MEIEALRIATLVARHGSFAGAARALDLDPSSVSRTVAGLEASLGARLFHRSTRTLSVTEEGAEYLARITPLLEELAQAKDAIHAGAKVPTGTLKLTASVSFTHTCIVPHLKEFTDLYPEVVVELLATDANVDLVAERIDLAIRLAPAPTGDLISTKLRTTRYILCAAPDYVAKHPPITTPSDLQDHNCLRFALPDYRTNWRFQSATGEEETVPVSGTIVISNALSLRDSTVNGLGVALLPDWLVGEDLAKGRLSRLLPDQTAAARSFDTAAWALYPSRSYLPQKVRVMIDFLRRKLG